jgi:hypothetical protein
MLAEVEMSAQNAAHAARFVPGWDLSVWGGGQDEAVNPTVADPKENYRRSRVRFPAAPSNMQVIPEGAGPVKTTAAFAFACFGAS